MDPLIVVFGFGVGILIGLTGVGGGSLMTPLLLITGGYSPVVAIGTDLAYGAITKTVGGWRHLNAGHVDLRLSWFLAAGSVPGSILGVITVNWLHAEYGEDFEPYLLGAVAVALMFASGAILYRALFRPGLIAKERESALLQRRISKVGTIAIGATLGFVLGLTSVGSGRTDRPRPDPALQAQAAARRGHRRLPRRRPALDRRARALHQRQRRFRSHGARS